MPFHWYIVASLQWLSPWGNKSLGCPDLSIYWCHSQSYLLKPVFLQLSSVLPALSGNLVCVWFIVLLSLSSKPFLNYLPPKSLMVSRVPLLGVNVPTLFQIQSFPLGRALELSDLKVESCPGGLSLLAWTPVLQVCWSKGYQDPRNFNLLYLE